MSRKLHISFDNFTIFQENTDRWMTPEEFEALPVLDDQHEELWQNYLRAKAAHSASCYAIQHVLQFPEGSPEKEVERQNQVFDKLWMLYCNSTNYDREQMTGDQAADLYKEIFTKMAELLEKEKERG